MQGGTISNCKSGKYGGAIFVSTNTSLVLNNAMIKNCSASSVAGGIVCNDATFKGSTSITNCSAAYYAAVVVQSSATLNIQDTTTIKNNNSTGSEADSCGTINTEGDSTAPAKVKLSGNPYIYENTNNSTIQANLKERSDADVADRILVAEEGLGENAKIGVYALNNYNAGDTFARTASASAVNSTNAANLEKFINDKDTSLKGHAGDDDEVIWSKFIPVNIVVNLDEVATEDMWFTLQTQSATTGQRSRIAVCVPKGSKTGSTVVLESSGIKNSFALISGGSPNGYTLSTPTLKNTPTTASGQTIGSNEALESSTSFLCYLTLSTACAKKGEIDSTSGIRELTFNASWTSPTDTTKFSGQSGVTNTMSF